MFDFIKNMFFNRNRYKTCSEAVVISCFMNPQNNPYRLLAFQKWYRSIKHLNHRIIELLIGDAKPQLPSSQYISRLHSDSLLWHKEALLNKIVADLPSQFQYVFWVDADVLFTNQNWLVEGVEELQYKRIIQPFEYCIHLNRNELEPSFDVDAQRPLASDSTRRHPQMWRSFCANVADNSRRASSLNYDVHGHVGFAWGARREVLEECPLYDNALIGGADHIIAHAAAELPDRECHPCITKSFTENLDEVHAWSKKFYRAVRGQVGYVKGDLYHIWHGDIKNREYLKRIRDYTPAAKNLPKDPNGLYVRTADNAYMKQYYRRREVGTVHYDDGFYDFYDDAAFIEDMGYAISDLIQNFGCPTYDDSDVPAIQQTAVESSPVQQTIPVEISAPQPSVYDYQKEYNPVVPDPVPPRVDSDMPGRYTETGESGRDNPDIEVGETGESGNFS